MRIRESAEPATPASASLHGPPCPRVAADRRVLARALVNLVENVVNIVLAVLLVDRYGLLGLGLAFALAYVVGAVVALVALDRRVPGLRLAPLTASLSRMEIGRAHV